MDDHTFLAGDVIQYESGRLDYLIKIPGEEGLWINACNPVWIDRGDREFCQECYPFTKSDGEAAKVVGHFGKGDASSARRWYRENRERYRA